MVLGICSYKKCPFKRSIGYNYRHPQIALRATNSPVPNRERALGDPLESWNYHLFDYVFCADFGLGEGGG